MQLLSFNFFYFVSAVFFVYLIAPDKFRWVVLLGAGYYFYWTINPLFLLFLIVPTIIVYIAGVALKSGRNKLVVTARHIDPFWTPFHF